MVLETVSSLGSALRTFSYSAMAFCSLPCWTNFSAALRAFCLLKPKPNAICLLTPAPVHLPPEKHLPWEARPTGWPSDRPCLPIIRGMVLRTRVIVRRVTKNRMVTKGYRKGVYDRVMSGTTADKGDYAPVNGGRGAGRSENETRVQRDGSLIQSLNRHRCPTNIDSGIRPRNTWKCASSLQSSVLSMRNATKI